MMPHGSNSAKSPQNGGSDNSSALSGRHPVLEEKPRLEEIKQGRECRVAFFPPPVGLKTHVGGGEALHGGLACRQDEPALALRVRRMAVCLLPSSLPEFDGSVP